MTDFLCSISAKAPVNKYLDCYLPMCHLCRVCYCWADNWGLSSSCWNGGHYSWKHGCRCCYSRAGLWTEGYDTVTHNVSKCQHNTNTSLDESTSEHLNSLEDVLHCGLAGASTCSGGWPQDSFGAGHNSCCSRPYGEKNKTGLERCTATNEW